MLTLKERHQARHATRDALAGGVGLGVLDTKRKHFRNSQRSRDSSVLSQHHSAQNLLTSNLTQATSAHAAEAESNSTPNPEPGLLPALPEESLEEWDATRRHSPDFYDSQLNFPDMYTFSDQSPGLYEIGDIYHDISFDLVHFSVTGCAPDLRSTTSQLQSEPTAILNKNGEQLTEEAPLGEPPNDPEDSRVSVDNALDLPMSGTEEISIAGQAAQKAPALALLALSTPRENHISSDAPDLRIVVANAKSFLVIDDEKRDELLDFLAEIQPVCPNGSILNGKSLHLSLASIQSYLNLFLKHFNTSYPLLHVATLDIRDSEPIVLLCLLLLGATYKDKDSHQISVCLYDAIIPYILNNMLSSPILDLSILQAFMVLECYGMYRAGPYQRENALLLHGVLLNVSPLP